MEGQLSFDFDDRRYVSCQHVLILALLTLAEVAILNAKCPHAWLILDEELSLFPPPPEHRFQLQDSSQFLDLI